MKYLIRKAQKGDDQAFMELIGMCRSSMYKVARSFLRRNEDMEDAISQTVLDCYVKMDSLRKPEYFKTWLIRILINNCKDILKSGRRECLLEEFPEQEDTCMALENYEFEELMNSLDEKYRVVLLLYYGEGFKIREIAQILEMDENTVKTRLSRGRKQFEHVYCLEPAVQRR